MHSHLICVVIAGSTSASPDLLRQARKVASTGSWDEAVWLQAEYEWIDDRTVLYYVENPEEQSERTVRRLDVQTKLSSILRGLTDLSPGVSLDPSPNGMFLLGWRRRPRLEYFIADLSGAVFGSWPIKASESRWDITGKATVCWMPDSSGLMETVCDSYKAGIAAFRTQIRPVLTPNLAKLVSKAEVRWPLLHYLGPQIDRTFRCHQIVDEKYIGVGVRDQQTIYSWPISRPQSLQKRRVSFGGAEISEAMVAPSGNAILWETTTAPSSPGSWVYEPKSSKSAQKGRTTFNCGLPRSTEQTSVCWATSSSGRGMSIWTGTRLAS